MTNPFSKDYVPQVKIDHRDRKYKRPVIDQPLRDVFANINTTKRDGTVTENYQRIAKPKI
jgi:hypothetical protein